MRAKSQDHLCLVLIPVILPLHQHERFVIFKSRIFRENRTTTRMDDASGWPFYARVLGDQE